ncbi:MAG: hypothetical protein ABI002_00120, partial [Saprospiraceae bacterium]
LSLNEASPKYWNKNESKNAKASSGKIAVKRDFLIRGAFDLLNSSSRDPSKTIKISPTVPSNGSMGVKSGILIAKNCVKYLTTKPKANSRITDGTLVLDDVKSKI